MRSKNLLFSKILATNWSKIYHTNEWIVGFTIWKKGLCMAESPYAKMRSRVRIKTDLKAHCFMPNGASQPVDCTVIDLSAAGAGLVFQHNGKISIGDIVTINIFLPNTILHVSVRAEIRWKRHRAKDCICGAQFQELLSERMFQQLIKKTP